MSAKKVVVLDASTGNVASVMRALKYVGADVSLSADRAEVLAADGFVVPGVGAFGAVMEKITKVGGDVLVAERLAQGLPTFGICVGEQVLFETSTERGAGSGLGIYKGNVELLDAPVVPHMGWSPIEVDASSQILRGLGDELFYFVHSYACMNPAVDSAAISWARHGNSRFVAAIETPGLCATQFHPEKSGDAGLTLLKQWLEILS